MTEPLVSIVTPTIPGRGKLLFERCMPSVRSQDWSGPIEHIIVSDQNPEYDDLHSWRQDNYTVRLVQINNTWKNDVTRRANGALPWFLGTILALGEFIGFLGDDDELHPHHVSAHVRAMREAEAAWSVSKVEFKAGGQFWNVIGDNTFIEGHLDATGIMCWKGALTVANWEPFSGYPAVDWLLVNRWREAGLHGVFVDQVTGIHHDGWLTGHTGKPYEET